MRLSQRFASAVKQLRRRAVQPAGRAAREHRPKFDFWCKKSYKSADHRDNFVNEFNVLCTALSAPLHPDSEPSLT
jgi:hypothetical protein